MQRLYDVTKWRSLRQGEALRFETARSRVVRLDVNSRADVGLYLLDAVSSETRFLAVTRGRDSVEFIVEGAFTLVSDGDIQLYTADGQFIHHEVVDPVIFTRITERRVMSPEIQEIQRMMNFNIERRLAAQRDGFNAVIHEQRRRFAEEAAARKLAEAAVAKEAEIERLRAMLNEKQASANAG